MMKYIMPILLLCCNLCTAQVTKYADVKDTALVKGMPPVNRIYIDSLPDTYVYKFCHYAPGKDPFCLLSFTEDNTREMVSIVAVEALTGSNAPTHDNEFQRIADLLHLTILK